MQKDKLPSARVSQNTSLDEQVKDIFFTYTGLALDKNYSEQLYTFASSGNAITVVYYVLLANENPTSHELDWKEVFQLCNNEQDIIRYAVQRLQWKLEYTNVVYSLLPKSFTLSDLQKTYQIILKKKLDKRNFRKKILSLKFLKPTGKKRIDSARPAQIYTFTKRSPIIVKVFS